MKLPYQVGITGGIGSGKSLVCRILQRGFDAPVYDADSRAKYLMQHKQELIEQIIRHFGKEAYHTDGTLNRAYLAERVFHDAQAVKQLNTLVHPQVALDYQAWLLAHKQFPYVVREAALMIESGAHATVDLLVLVAAPVEVRIRRVLQRDPHRNRAQVEAIIAKQMSEEEKRRYAHYVIENDGTRPLLPQVVRLHELITKAIRKQQGQL
ncbi:dephospho-CoA kinase [Thermonema rossianum]|uniref:dephospho-CoA kinase n=1 Tax=Thermonema rossianum TaxID=55505 RepID=UPI00056EAF41|nr:dephospho-CoA kinase [Thermonema rossianum]